MKWILTGIAGVVFVMVITACGPSRTEVPSLNRGTLSTSGETVGTLPDGREVRRWAVWDSAGIYVHTIYVVDGTATVTTNRPSGGKASHNMVEVMIDGKVYVPKE